MKKQSMVTMIYGFAVIFIIMAGAGCKKKVEEVKEEVVPVKVMPVELRDIRHTLDYVGDIEAQDDAIVYPKVSGKIIEKLKEEGSEVGKGDVIAYIDRDEVGFKFEKAAVESPLTGVVGRVDVDLGTQVTPQTPIALVVDMDKVEIRLDVPEKYLPKIAPGQPADITVDAYPGRIFTGEVTRLSPVVDIKTRTAPVEIVFSNPGHCLKPGMYARVALVIEEHEEVPVILQEAIIGRQSKPYVYLAKEGIAHKRYISLGLRKGPYFEVIDGLQAGDEVVIMGQQRLHDNAPVMVER